MQREMEALEGCIGQFMTVRKVRSGCRQILVATTSHLTYCQRHN
jgi:hypothetical protein